MQTFFAQAIPGTERVLCDELRELGFESVRLNRGGIPFRGEWRDGWRACLQSRVAQRIQLLLGRFDAPTPEALYAGIQSVDWNPYITFRHTMAVGVVSRSSAVNHSGFAALKVKDAIVDQIRAKTHRRPSVDRDDPDVRVFLYLVADKATVYLDLSGGSMHRRGYRTEAGEAPLRETLAAALLRMSKWDRKTPLIDPMGGSGTIPIEAALMAGNVAPGLARERFGFERWSNFRAPEVQAMRELRGELRAAANGQLPRIVCGDIDVGMQKLARANARRAGVRLSFRQSSVFDIQCGETPGLVVTNPPYGVRLEADPEFVRKTMAAFSRLHGWRVCLLAGSPAYARAMSVHPASRQPLRNGDIDCDFLEYVIP